MKRVIPLLILATMFCMAGCKDADNEISISLFADYNVDGQDIKTDTLCYHNDAGNNFMINEIQWFISHIEIKNEKGEWLPLNGNGDIHYLEYQQQNRNPFHWQSLSKGQYDALRFTFGLNETDNQTSLFPNPPESEMFWPEPLGGGYHYMKINGKWLDNEGNLVPLCIHLGIGQNAQLTEFYPNHFSVEIPFENAIGLSDCSITISMNINNWFRNPNTYNFNDFGSGIMQNQVAQQTLKENGCDVFSVSIKAN